MNAAIYPSLGFTVAMLVCTAYFLMGGLPLLVLKHDTPLDARFVRSFFNLYYKVAIGTSLGACVSYALWGRLRFALGAGALLAVTLLLRRTLIPAMQQLGNRIQGDDQRSIRDFRRIHIAALAINLLQLVLIVWGVVLLSL
ncbi:hypothetical protein [Piscinibacter koreensis]|uniref:DUF4149 domain-containing protein n=1 Tax=Piscinibacter koreensis TaxID=2742824 RepID=A0A7Y6TVQ9_9BURK|nr:hypothetical protein [Schlegelella koreensis]NUZ05374.1 hypothetical protein [Schlegelella koreensis]